MLEAKKVLIYRLGSIGDTVVALPLFHLIAKVFPNAERRLLTNFPVSSKTAPVEDVLENSGLVSGYIYYQLGIRDPRPLIKLRKKISQFHPDILIYLTSPRGILNIIRDYVFFKICGLKKVVGVPFSKSLRTHSWLASANQYESETSRLSLCLEALGKPDLSDHTNWSLNLSIEERQRAINYLDGWQGKKHFFTFAPGTKMDVKDWGESNWIAFFTQMANSNFSHYGVVFVGAKGDFDLSERLRIKWSGPSLNLCGKLSPRESAAIIEQGVIFVGHDSGPMHLAASVGIPILSIFSARVKPGVWFPHGTHNIVLYPTCDCYGCQLEVCTQFNKKCISSITVDEVTAAFKTLIRKQQQKIENIELC